MSNKMKSELQKNSNSDMTKLIYNSYLMHCKRVWTIILIIFIFSGEPIANNYWYSGQPDNYGKNFSTKLKLIN